MVLSRRRRRWERNSSSGTVAGASPAVLVCSFACVLVSGRVKSDADGGVRRLSTLILLLELATLTRVGWRMRVAAVVTDAASSPTLAAKEAAREASQSREYVACIIEASSHAKSGASPCGAMKHREGSAVSSSSSKGEKLSATTSGDVPALLLVLPLPPVLVVLPLSPLLLLELLSLVGPETCQSWPPCAEDEGATKAASSACRAASAPFSARILLHAPTVPSTADTEETGVDSWAVAGASGLLLLWRWPDASLLLLLLLLLLVLLLGLLLLLLVLPLV